MFWNQILVAICSINWFESFLVHYVYETCDLHKKTRKSSEKEVTRFKKASGFKIIIEFVQISIN